MKKLRKFYFDGKMSLKDDCYFAVFVFICKGFRFISSNLA
jgi:hypothetical protein